MSLLGFPNQLTFRRKVINSNQLYISMGFSLKYLNHFPFHIGIEEYNFPNLYSFDQN